MEEVSPKEIRDDLKEIRYYYSHLEIFEKAKQCIGAHKCLDKIKKYNNIIRNAPIRLYEIYVALYLDNNTLESLADKEGYSYVHIQRINGQLIKYLQDEINKKGEIENE